MDVSIGGLIGVYGGLAIGALAWAFGRKKLKKERGLDEMQTHIREKSRSLAWFVTTALIYFFLTLTMIGIDMSMSVVLSLLLLGHLGSWGITAVILSINFTREAPVKSQYIAGGILLICLPLTAFTLITVATQVWWYVLLGIPFAVAGLFIALFQPKSA
ncbi:hypothetical protein [Lentibacillus saliphilus]|uniref:hypothetical protein n=1 Tax=Lentibacillus saliphilus TaxID=2737028 RepID=UPI001C304DB0|nr:hypothetical protein [Lentibacillus saliphilus]